jgi:hypothetical protein
MSTNFKHFNRNLGAIGEPPKQFTRKHQAKRAWKPIRFTHAGLATHALGMDGDEEEAADEEDASNAGNESRPTENHDHSRHADNEQKRDPDYNEGYFEQFVRIPGDDKTTRTYQLVNGEDQLPDELDSDNVDPSYGNGIMQTNEGEFNPRFLGYSLKLIERIDACKHASQRLWDDMLIYPEYPAHCKESMNKFLDMQGKISRDRLLILGGLVAGIRARRTEDIMPSDEDEDHETYEPTQPINVKEIHPPDMLNLLDAYTPSMSSISYQHFNGEFEGESTNLHNLVETTPVMSWTCPINHKICLQLFRVRDIEHGVPILQGCLGLILNSLLGLDNDAFANLGAELRLFQAHSDWVFTQNQTNTGLSMPAWSYPRDSKVEAAVWRSEGGDDTHYMEIIVGGVSLSIFKKFYNPRVVQFIKLHVLETAMDSLQDPAHYHEVNFTTLTVKIRKGLSLYSLTIHPMHTPDSCLASHISFTQDIDLDSNPNAGIIVLPNNMSAITTLRRKDVKSYQNIPYLLCGAYKGVKLNEEKINEIHARGCFSALKKRDQIWNPMDDNLTYDFEEPGRQDIEYGRLPKGKVVRISKGIWDIMASSHLTSSTEIKTIISIVLYPPFGTHIKPRSLYKSGITPMLPHSGRHPGQPNQTLAPAPVHRGDNGYYASGVVRGQAAHSEPRQMKSRVKLPVNFFIQGFFEGHTEHNSHLLTAVWKADVSKEIQETTRETFGHYIDTVKRMVSADVRDVLNSKDGSDRYQTLHGLLDDEGNGKFFDFLQDPDTHKLFKDTWVRILQEYLGNHAMNAAREKPGSGWYSTLPFVFKTTSDDEKEIFLDSVFVEGVAPEQRAEYSKMMGSTKGVIHDAQPTPQVPGGFIIQRGGGRGGGGGRGRGGYRGG